MYRRISGKLDQSKSLDLNLYEIRIDQHFIEKTSIIDIFLYECQCALLLVDATSKESFQLIKDLLKVINVSKFPYLKLILVLNKIDLESTRQITSNEIYEYLENNKNLDSQEISLKRGDNFNELLNKINAAVNETKNQLPINIISEVPDKKIYLENEEITLNLILIGDRNSGKKYFLERNFKNQDDEIILSTIGIDKEIMHIKKGNDYYKVSLWDTAGQDRYKSLPKKYYISADGILLLFDVTNKETFNDIIEWVKEIKYNLNINSEGEQGSEKPIYLIGNKIDLPGRVITKEEAEKQAKLLGVKYFEVCGIINMNIPEVMARMIMDCPKKTNHNDNNFILKSKSSGKGNKKGCYEEKKEKRKK